MESLPSYNVYQAD